MGKEVGSSLNLALKELNTNKVITVPDVPTTVDNRSAVWESRQQEGHLQPTAVQEAGCGARVRGAKVQEPGCGARVKGCREPYYNQAPTL